jgi:hypothetical protein
LLLRITTRKHGLAVKSARHRDIDSVETAENAAQRNLNTNDILGMIIPALWQVALQVAKLTAAVEKARG